MHLACSAQEGHSYKKLIDLLVVTRDGVKCHGRNRGKISKPFEDESTVHQSCILPLVLFVRVIGDVSHATLSGGVQWIITYLFKHFD